MLLLKLFPTHGQKLPIRHSHIENFFLQCFTHRLWIQRSNYSKIPQEIAFSQALECDATIAFPCGFKSLKFYPICVSQF
jgi:hypothetical protein